MKNLKNKILQEFLNSDIKIISQEKLEQYIEYCIYKNQNSRIEAKSAHHHILPKALFDEYKDLKQNLWNGTHLLYSDHYYAHWLLAEAIEDAGQLEAFCKMHNGDTKLGRIDESDLIPPEEFQKISELSYRLREQKLNEEYFDKNGNITTKRKEMAKNRRITIKKTMILEDGTITSIAKEGSKKGVITRKLNGTDKIASQKRHLTMKENGGYIVSGRKSAETRTKEIILEDGTITSIAKEAIKVRDKTMQEVIIHDNKQITKEDLRIMNVSIGMKKEIIVDGRITTPAKEAARKVRETMKAKGKFYNIFDKDDNLIAECIARMDIKEIYPTLMRFTKDHPLGNSSKTRNILINNNKEYLIGAYCVMIKGDLND